MTKVITRFPPSPTGTLHIGGARTALFNWLFARGNGGTFVLRMEDTDQVRSTKESEVSILEALDWMGLDWDQGPFYQSQRTPVYWEHVEKLLEQKKAYWCHCSPEVLDEKRKKAMASGGKPKYDGTCRNQNLEKAPGAVVRLATPDHGSVVFEDAVKGHISWPNEELDDLIIWRSDDTPTYHLAVVVDDVTMGITHIIRGDDHVSNTPRQIHIYKALEADIPIFAHVPMVLGPDKKRLSKRHGATSVTEYRDMGIQPEAFVNFMARLGWSYGDQEYFTIEELIEKFSLDNIGKSAGVFDMQRLLDLSGDHIRATSVDDLVEPFLFELGRLGVKSQDKELAQKVIPTLHERSKTLVEMAEKALFYYQDDIEFDEKAAKKFLKPAAAEPLKVLIEQLEKITDMSEKAVEDAFVATMEKTELKLGKIAQPVRVALTGQTASPGIFEVIDVLGLEKTLQRLKKAQDFVAARDEG